MILSEDYLQQLLGQALEQVRVPEGSAAVLEGSIAEGFGNDSSDVDFLVIDDSEQSYAGTPTVLFVDQRRIEVRLRSTSDIDADRERLLRLGGNGGGRVARIPEDLLNRCQRLRHAFPLEGHTLVETVQQALPEQTLEGIASRFFASRCRQSARRAVAMVALEQSAGAVSWARDALTYGAKAWVAAHGETYVETKWLSEQLDRVPADGDTRKRIQTLMRSPASRSQPLAYVTEVLELLPVLGVRGCGLEPDRASFKRAPGVTTWPIAERLHVLRGQDVFVLGSGAGRIWRHVVFEQPLPAIMDSVDAERERAGDAFAEFIRLGLVQLQWKGGGTISGAPASTPSPSTTRPVLTLGGAVLDDEELAIKLVPTPARRFAAAGMALTWGNVMIENAREDAVGAVAQRQWGLLDAVARRMLRRSCLTVLSAYGIDPLPSQEEACNGLRWAEGLDPAIVADAVELDGRLTVDGQQSAEEAVREVERLVVRMREITDAEEFPSSFVDAQGWRQTLETFYDWVRIGAYLDSTFPLDDLRDVLTSVGERQKAVNDALS